MKLRTCGLVVSAAFVVACVLGSASAQFYQQGPKLVGAGAIDLSEQGGSVALSGDGSTAIFGGPDDNGGTGAAWVYTRSNGVWTQQAKLVGTGAIGNASQGASVSLSGDGNTAIIGGPNDNGFNGAAWVFTRSGGVWSQQAKLIATDAIRLPTQGRSVSLSHDGNTAIVGGPDDNFGLGAAWVFTRSGGVWTQQAKLVGTGAIGPGGGQGTSVSLSGDGNTAIVGEPRPNGSAGAAWVFTRSGGVWGQQQQLVGTGAVPGSCLGPSQGASVSLSDDGSTAIVGGPLDDGTQEHCSDAIGAAWMFTRSGGVWSQQGPKLVGSGALPEAGQQGRSVSLSGDGNTAIIGGPFGSLSGNSIGAAWVFTRPSGVWSQQQKPPRCLRWVG